MQDECAMQHAFIALARGLHFAVDEMPPAAAGLGPLLPAAGIVVDDDRRSYRISGNFQSSGVEPTAGAMCMPQALRALHFLQFAMHKEAPLQYTIVQQHQSVYAFSFPDLARSAAPEPESLS